MKDEKHPSEESPSLEIGGALRESAIAEDRSAAPEATRTFPQQGSWQLQCYQTTRTFMCTRCKNLSQSKVIACDVARRNMPVCNKYYDQLLADSRRATASSTRPDHSSSTGEWQEMRSENVGAR